MRIDMSEYSLICQINDEVIQDKRIVTHFVGCHEFRETIKIITLSDGKIDEYKNFVIEHYGPTAKNYDMWDEDEVYSINDMLPEYVENNNEEEIIEIDNVITDQLYEGKDQMKVDCIGGVLDVYIPRNETTQPRAFSIVLYHSMDYETRMEIIIQQESAEFTIEAPVNEIILTTWVNPEDVTQKETDDTEEDLRPGWIKELDEIKEIDAEIDDEYIEWGNDEDNDTEEGETFDVVEADEEQSVNHGENVWDFIMNYPHDEYEEVDEDETVQKTETIECEGDNNCYQKIDIPIFVNGGRMDFKIINISKIKEDNEDVENVTVLPFDNGFILTKDENSLVIKNYGKPFLEENVYYIITLQHVDDDTIQTTIKVTYSKEGATNTYHAPKIDIPLTPQTSKLYLPFIEEDITEEDSGTITSYEIKVYNDDGTEVNGNYDVMGVIGKPLKIVVKENGEESDLLLNASSTALWCDITLLQKYDENQEIVRTMKVIMKDTPIAERKSLIKLSIIDVPSVTKTFILTNYPYLKEIDIPIGDDPVVDPGE